MNIPVGIVGEHTLKPSGGHSGILETQYHFLVISLVGYGCYSMLRRVMRILEAIDPEMRTMRKP